MAHEGALMAPPKTTEPAAPLTEQVEAWTLTLSDAPPLTPATLRAAARVAAWRAIGAALEGDPAKAPAAAAAAAEALQASEPEREPDDGPVSEREVARAVILAVRAGLASPDPKRVGEAVALWRAERAWVDPEGLAGAGAAEGDALSAALERVADEAARQALAMTQAGATGL